MHNSIISKVFNGSEMFFDKINGELYLNATKTAKHFNKRVDKWKENSQTVEYLKALSNCPLKGKLEFIISKEGRYGGTWIHKKLIIFFARWLNSDFAVWCDTQIDEIIKGKAEISKLIQQRTDLISVSTEEMEKEFKALEFVFKNSNISESEKQFLINQVSQKINFANLEKLKEYKEVFTLTQLLSEFQVGILPHNFNWKLRSFGIVKF